MRYATKKAAKKAAPKPKVPAAPLQVTGSPTNFRARVRMYRHGLGDCFLLTFPRDGNEPFHMLIDCGVLAQDAAFMKGVVGHIRDTITGGQAGAKATLDVVAATHEHKDHLSGFNQARDLFDSDFEFGAVWLAWTENLTEAEAQAIKDAKAKAIATLTKAVASDLGKEAPLAGVAELLGFSSDDEGLGAKTVAEALEYLKARGTDAKNLEYLKPGRSLSMRGVKGWRVHVLGPPTDPILLKRSEVTKKMKDEGVIYHLADMGELGIDSLAAAIPGGVDAEGTFPFGREHRLVRDSRSFGAAGKAFLDVTYDKKGQEWRRIDTEWMHAFGELALHLDSDTNNTSLVLAFEHEDSGDVLLFVGDAQVGNWLSWEKVSLKSADGKFPALDLLERTVFYKVGHHCSHNATVGKGGLERMKDKKFVAFIPLDEAVARNQGTKGWDMPAGPLHTRLTEKAKLVVRSDKGAGDPSTAKKAGVFQSSLYIDYFLK